MNLIKIDALMEEKLHKITDQAMMKVQKDIAIQMNNRTKNIRDYLDTQLRRSQLAIKNL